MPSSHLILSSHFPPASNPFQHQSLSNESTLRMRWPKYWSFSFSIIPSKVIPGLISFRMDWLDLLAVQGSLKSLLQHHSSKASILQCSAFFTVQLSHPYMTTGKRLWFFPDQQLLKPACWNSGKVMKTEWSIFPVIMKWGTQKGFCVQEPHKVLLSTESSPLWMTNAKLWIFFLCLASLEISKNSLEK